MALNPQNRLAVFRTVGEAFAITWALPAPYVVLVLLTVLPWSVMSALGLFDPLGAYAVAMGSGQDGYGPADYPIGALLLSWISGFLMMVVFGIFWYRYVLLGREGALRFGVAQFNGMFWRTAGYGLAVLLIVLVVLVGMSIGLGLLAGLISVLFSTTAGMLVTIVIVVLVLVIYAVPLALVARLSLPFPAFALGQRLSLRQSWSLTKGSAWRMVGAFLTAGLPVSLIAYALYFGLLYGLLGVNILLPEHAAAALDYWWFTLLLSPAMYLPVALCLAVVAFAYRDLGRIPSTEAAPDVRPAR